MSHPKDPPRGRTAVTPRRLALGTLRDMRRVLKATICLWALPTWLSRIQHDPQSWDELRRIAIYIQDAATRLASFCALERERLRKEQQQ